MLWPAKLAVIYPHPATRYAASEQWPLWEIGLAALLLVAISCLCIFLARRKPYLAVGWFWYLGMMLPVIGIIQVGEQAMADRYTYLPLMGPTISLVWLAWELSGVQKSEIRGQMSERDQNRRTLAVTRLTATGVIPALVAVGLLTACAILTYRQIGYWRNTVTLFAHAVAFPLPASRGACQPRSEPRKDAAGAGDTLAAMRVRRRRP